MFKFATKITPEFLDLICQYFGTEPTTLEDDQYVVIEVLSDTEFHAKIISEDEVVELAKTDTALEIM